MSYLRCPDCRLTAHATAYYIQGDRCPRCLTVMEPAERFRDVPHASRAAVASVEEAGTHRAAPSAG